MFNVQAYTYVDTRTYTYHTTRFHICFGYAKYLPLGLQCRCSLAECTAEQLITAIEEFDRMYFLLLLGVTDLDVRVNVQPHLLISC